MLEVVYLLQHDWLIGWLIFRHFSTPDFMKKNSTKIAFWSYVIFTYLLCYDPFCRPLISLIIFYYSYWITATTVWFINEFCHTINNNKFKVYRWTFFKTMLFVVSWLPLPTYNCNLTFDMSSILIRTSKLPDGVGQIDHLMKFKWRHAPRF